MNNIKKYLIECGYTETVLDGTDVKFESDTLSSFVNKWQHHTGLRQFVEFAAHFNLTPYSGNRDCLLFKLVANGSSVRNTVIGGFNADRQEFELSGTRLNPSEISSALNSQDEWLQNIIELGGLASNSDIFNVEGDESSPSYFRIQMNHSKTETVLEQFIRKWWISVQGSALPTSVSIEKYFVEIFANNGGNNDGWIREYRAYNELSVEEKIFSDTVIKELWTKPTTSVASIKKGIMSGEDYRSSEPELIEFTRQLARGASPELYKQSVKLLNQLVEEGKISRRYWATTNRVFASLHPTQFSTTVSEKALRKVYQYLDARFKLKLKDQNTLDWYGLNQELLSEIQPRLKDVMDTSAINVTLWFIYESISESLEVRELASHYGDKSLDTPPNQILFGPPGTGKTYHTIEAAVQAAEPNFYHSLQIEASIGATNEQRIQLQSKFKELSDSKRIRFVTFHQSYGYEEFVEGLAASSVDGQISYAVKTGIFKEICEQASRGVEESNDPFEIALDTMKSKLEEDTELTLSTQRGKTFNVQYHGNTTFRAFPHETVNEDLGNGYPVSIDSVRKLYRGADFKEFYNPSYVKAILEHLINNYSVPRESVVKAEESKNFVLVIDEINRGNISKIFGELITLIEQSKRAGESEALEVTLPHSGQKFSVPKNLYIIGTMNTADRSLAMMDTALRRRFDFVEMMPRPELLKGTVIEGIDLEKLLSVLNQRLEILYDREHTLGHAFFMPIKALVDAGDQVKAFKALVSVFQNKIIPLLEEYFFEDWSKIRMVLADNQKKEASLQFVREHKKESKELDALFGRNHNLDQYGQQVVKYTVSASTDDVWTNAQAYIGIYQPNDERNTPVAEATEEVVSL